MKTAISIPDNIYNSAEELAGRLGESRSELYAKAVNSYVKKYRNEKVTEKLNEVYDGQNSAIDPSLASLQTQSVLKNNRW